MENRNPLISVLMTAYNREKYIAEAIESVLASTYNNFELIVVDDHSTDDTVAIVNRYAVNDSRIQVYINEKNMGDYSNRNLAVSYAKGTYIFFVDSDDKTYPDSLAYCVNSMLQDINADMGILCRVPELCEKILNPEQSVQYHFFDKQFLIIGPGGTITKKSFFDSINGYPEKYGPANDMYFNLKAASHGNLKCLCKEFLYHRIHEEQEANNEFSYLINNYLYTKDALKEIQLPLTLEQIHYLSKKNKRRFVVNLFNYFLKTMDLKKTRQVIKKTEFTFKEMLQGIFQ